MAAATGSVAEASHCGALRACIESAFLAEFVKPDSVIRRCGPLLTEFTSWGDMIAKGATTIWERWNGDTGDVAMNSFNHYAPGAITGFL